MSSTEFSRQGEAVILIVYCKAGILSSQHRLNDLSIKYQYQGPNGGRSSENVID